MKVLLTFVTANGNGAEMFELCNKVVKVIWIVCFLCLMQNAVWAKPPTFDPAKVASFCPPEMTIADAKNAHVLSIKEQQQIKKIVQGFMKLEADARRVGHRLGSKAYWEQGYTLPFEEVYETPPDGLDYLAWRYLNICTKGGEAQVSILLDVGFFMGSYNPDTGAKRKRHLSGQKYWDFFTQSSMIPPYKPGSYIPPQPIVLAAIPLVKTDHWRIDQPKTPILHKLKMQELFDQHRSIIVAGHCTDPKKASKEWCASTLKKDRDEMRQMQRPAWSLLPKDFDSASLQK